MEIRMKQKQYRVAFVCTHNSCRSQMAEAIAKKVAKDVLIPFSAGTNPNQEINQNAVKIIMEIYGVDMRKSQHPKLISELPVIDILITMGCGVNCPMIPCSFREDWGLDDPTGKAEEIYFLAAALIKNNILNLKKRIVGKNIIIE